MAEWVGSLIAKGRYRVIAKLGEGGMGTVFRAHDSNLDADVVIKAPRRAMLEDPEFAARFTLEIRSLVKLSHPHVVKVTDVGEFDGLPFAVMQFLSGGDLKDRQTLGADGARLPMFPQDLNTWLPGIATALDFVHTQGYIHRDVKPANILFDRHGNSYLSDFGVAKVVSEREQRGASLTGTGMVLGTPEYMAPELIMGQAYDGRVDQYALAATVYEVLCGRVPIEGPTPAAILVNHTTQQVQPLSDRVSHIPAEVSATVLRGLAKDPQQRYPDCRALSEAVLAAVAKYEFSTVNAGSASGILPDVVVQPASGALRARPAMRDTMRSLATTLKHVVVGKPAVGPSTRATKVAAGLRFAAIALVVVLAASALYPRLFQLLAFLRSVSALQWTFVVVGLLATSMLIQWGMQVAARRAAAAPQGRVRRRLSGSAVGAIVAGVLGVGALAVWWNGDDGKDNKSDLRTDGASPDAPPVESTQKAPPVELTADEAWEAIPLARRHREGDFTNSLGMKMVCLLPGRIPQEDGRRQIEQPFWIAEAPVTLAQYLAFVDSRRGRDLPEWLEADSDQFFEKPESRYAPFKNIQRNGSPVVGISQSDVSYFCDWLTELEEEGHLPRRISYSPPDENEWGCALQTKAIVRAAPTGASPFWEISHEELLGVADTGGAAVVRMKEVLVPNFNVGFRVKASEW